MSERAAGRIRTGLAKLRLAAPGTGLPPQEARAVLDVSPTGAGVKVATPFATDQELAAELYHPILDRAVQLQARVAWCRMVQGDPLPHAGLEFVTTSEQQRLALRLIQAAEVSCRVLDGARTMGFIMNPTEGVWALYDASTTKVATLRRSGAQFEVTFLGQRPEDSVHSVDVASLPEAVALALGLERAPLIIPPEGGSWSAVPLDDPPRAQPRGVAAAEPAAPAASPEAGVEAAPSQAAYHTVLAGGYHVGYVAVTSVEDAWSLFDEAQREVAVITPAANGKYRVVPVGADPNDSLAYAMAKTFLGAVRVGFGLSVDPEVDPPVGPEAAEVSAEDLSASQSDIDLSASTLMPDVVASEVADDEEASAAAAPAAAAGGGRDRERYRVLGSDGLVGFIAPTLGLDGVWSAYAPTREKVAMIAPEGGRFRVVFMGTDPDDSLEYMVARTLKGAIALTFELDGIPTFDPPFEAR